MKNTGLEKYLSKDQFKNGTGISVSERKVTHPCPLHWHNFIELELITGGRGEQMLNGQKYELTKGCLSIMRLTDFHQVIPIEQLSLLNLMVDDRLLSEEMLSKISSGQTLFYKTEETEYTEFEQLLSLCKTENDRPSPDQRYLKHLIICIFLKILRLAPESFKNRSDDRPIQTALLYLHMHFRENPKLGDVAKIAHYNASHFSATFHRELGMTYSEYLNMLKITYAKELILSTDLKIADICFECGFSSHSNFLRLFKEKTGLSPMQFRKRAIDKTKPQDL